MAGQEEKMWYAAFQAKDARFDGRFFIGVTSTGIYCRPVCRAKLPKAENCTFHATAAAAEQAGFRPCLLCRPELAPGHAPVDAVSALALQAARRLEETCGQQQSMEELAAQLGCTSRHLRRAFAQQYGVSPVRYLQTCRLLLAKSLLTDTGLSVTEVAMAAGFGSLRRFNDLFQKQYGLSPTGLRRRAASGKGQAGAITVGLGYRPPYQWQQMLDFLADHAIPGAEVVADGQYLRTVSFVAKGRSYCGWVRVGHQPQSNTLSVTVDAALLPVLPRVLARIRHLFDLYCDPAVIYEALALMNEIRPGLCVPGIRLPGSFDPFETAVRTVLGQQISRKSATTLAGRLVEAFGATVETGIKGLTHSFPKPEDIMALPAPISGQLGPLGITRARSESILEMARAFVRGDIPTGLCAQPEQEVEKLMRRPGIGPWTAQYMAMRMMAWPDAFPHTDYAVKQILAPRTPKELLALAEAWRPWRSYATMCLWNSLPETAKGGK